MDISPKFVFGVISATSLLPSALLQNTTITGVGWIIGGAALGTYAAIAYDDNTTRPRGRMFSLATGTVIFASALTGVLPHLTEWHWINGMVGGGASILCALIIYYGLPEAIPAFRRIMRGFKLSDLPFFRKSSPDAAPAGVPTPEGVTDK